MKQNFHYCVNPISTFSMIRKVTALKTKQLRGSNTDYFVSPVKKPQCICHCVTKSCTNAPDRLATASAATHISACFTCFNRRSGSDHISPIQTVYFTHCKREKNYTLCISFVFPALVCAWLGLWLQQGSGKSHKAQPLIILMPSDVHLSGAYSKPKHTHAQKYACLQCINHRI